MKFPVVEMPSDMTGHTPAAGEEAAVQEMVEPGSVVHTDGCAGYAALGGKKYNARLKVRSIEEIGDNLLPLAHRVAYLLKRWIGGTHQGAVRPSHIDHYLDEFTFRFNRRTSRSLGKLFYRLLQQVMQVVPVTDDDIRGGKSCQAHKIWGELGSSG